MMLPKGCQREFVALRLLACRRNVIGPVIILGLCVVGILYGLRDARLNAGLSIIAADCRDLKDGSHWNLPFLPIEADSGTCSGAHRADNEQLYKTVVELRRSRVAKDGLPQDVGQLWDVFDADGWKCPGVRAHGVDYSGQDAEGPKFLCGFEQVGDRPCVVYSFGSNADTKFEHEITSRHPRCEVHIFDPTVRVDRMKSVMPTCSTFHSIGLAANSGTSKSMTKPTDLLVDTLPNLMQRLGHSYIDVFKLDVEGFEWEALEKMFDPKLAKDHPKVGQILVEMHLTPQLAPGRSGHDMIKIQGLLEAAGFRLFHLRKWTTGRGAGWNLCELAYVHKDWVASGREA